MSMEPEGAETLVNCNLNNWNFWKDILFKMRTKCDTELTLEPELYADRDAMKTAVRNSVEVEVEVLRDEASRRFWYCAHVLPQIILSTLVGREPLQARSEAVRRLETGQGCRPATRQPLCDVARPLRAKRCSAMETSGWSRPFPPSPYLSI